jgi:hypothetical protein
MTRSPRSGALGTTATPSCGGWALRISRSRRCPTSAAEARPPDVAGHLGLQRSWAGRVGTGTPTGRGGTRVVDRGEHDADRLRLPLGQEDLCLSLALRVQDRGLFGACGGDPAVAEIEPMIHRKASTRPHHLSAPRTGRGGAVPSTPTGRFRVFRGAPSHRRSGPGSPPDGINTLTRSASPFIPRRSRSVWLGRVEQSDRRAT